MKIKVQKIGNAEGVVIPKQTLARLGWKAGDKLALSTTGGIINLQAAEATIEGQTENTRREIDR